jgi:hypothetical protein
MDDFPTVAAKDVRPGMLVKYPNHPAVMVGVVGYLPLSDRYVFGFIAQYVNGGFEVFSTVQETRVFNANEEMHLIKSVNQW